MVHVKDVQHMVYNLAVRKQKWYLRFKSMNWNSYDNKDCILHCNSSTLKQETHGPHCSREQQSAG